MNGLPGGHPERLGLFGGTFDPFHNGHLVAAAAAIEAFSLERVVLVPTGQPWQKSSYSAPEDRVLMATLGAAEDRRLSVSRVEVDRRGPTYTIDTLESFKRFFPETKLYFIMGTDAAQALATWHRVDELDDLAELIAVHRPPFDPMTAAGAPGPQVHTLDIAGVDISSTDIRARVANGAGITDLVPAAVARFIQTRGLYRADVEARGA